MQTIKKQCEYWSRKWVFLYNLWSLPALKWTVTCHLRQPCIFQCHFGGQLSEAPVSPSFPLSLFLSAPEFGRERPLNAEINARQLHGRRRVQPPGVRAVLLQKRIHGKTSARFIASAQTSRRCLEHQTTLLHVFLSCHPEKTDSRGADVNFEIWSQWGSDMHSRKRVWGFNATITINFLNECEHTSARTVVSLTGLSAVQIVRAEILHFRSFSKDCTWTVWLKKSNDIRSSQTAQREKINKNIRYPDSFVNQAHRLHLWSQNRPERRSTRGKGGSFGLQIPTACLCHWLPNKTATYLKKILLRKTDKMIL